MYTLNSGDVSYIVPMDYIDLKFLRRNETVGDTVKPLWSPRQEEYTEFQLKAWRLSDSEDSLDEDAIKTTTCHICNIQVPVAYLKQHNNSNKHKNFLQIIDEVLSRLRSNVGFPLIATPEPPKSTYYCETCSIIVLTKDKDVHEGSSIHKKSLKHDEDLECFLMLYRKDNTVKNDKNICNASNKTAPKERFYKIATPLEELKEYVNAISKKINSNIEINVLDENFITITLGGSCMKVYIDKFHSFIYIDDGFCFVLVCLLCNDTVISKDHHIWTEEHMEHITRPIVDRHCIRQINTELAHCIICNDLIRSVGEHKALALNHKKNLENAQYKMFDDTFCHRNQLKQAYDTDETPLEHKKKEENALESNVVINHEENLGNAQFNTLDTICQNPQMKQADKTAASPPKDKKNEENAPISNVEYIEKKSDKPIETETKYVHYLISQTDNPKEVLCGVCQCAVLNLHRNIDEHLNGRNHRNKYNEFLTTNKIKKVQNGFACDYCRLHVENMKEMQHVLSQYHKVNMQKGIIGDQTYCEACKVYIDTHNMAQHQNGQKHKQKATQPSGKVIAKSNPVVESKSYAMATSHSNQNESSQNKVLQTESVQAAKNINQLTSASNNPVNNAQGLMGVNQTPMTKEKNGSVLPEAKLPYLFKVTSNPKELTCKVCNIAIPNTANNITSHTNGYIHKTKYNNLLHINKVVKVDFHFHCNVCDVKITNKNEVDHILGIKHKNVFGENYSGSAVSDTNNVQTTNNQTQHSTTDKQYNEKLYHFKNTSNANEVICRVCNVRMTNSVVNIVGHLNGNNHTTKYNDLLNLNKVVMQANNFRCNKCNTYITRTNELCHIFGNKHQFAMLSDDESSVGTSDGVSTRDDVSTNNHVSDTNIIITFCEFCFTYVASSDYQKHIMSKEHVNNISRETNNSLVLQYTICHDILQTKKFSLKCRICHCSVPNAYTCAMEHIRGDPHMTAHDRLLEINKICWVGDKLFCLACKDFIASNAELLHVREPNHTGNVSVMK